LKKNKRNTVYGIIAIIIFLVCIIIFTVGNKNSNTKNSKQNNSSSTMSKNNSMTFLQLANKNETRLWFSFQGFTNSPSTLSVSTKLDRNETINALFVTKNGYITKYNAENLSNDNDTKRLSIKDINTYSDKKIIEKFKEIDKKNFESNINSLANTSDELGYTDEANEYRSMKYNVPKRNKIKILASDNGTNNEVTNEKITSIYKWTTTNYNDAEQEHLEDGTVKHPIKFENPDYKTESFVIGIQKGDNALPTSNLIDNINFAGFGGNFVTRIGKNQSLSFDSYKDIKKENK